MMTMQRFELSPLSGKNQRISLNKELQIAGDQSHTCCVDSCDKAGLVKMENGDIAQQPVKRQTLKLRFTS